MCPAPPGRSGTVPHRPPTCVPGRTNRSPPAPARALIGSLFDVLLPRTCAACESWIAADEPLWIGRRLGEKEKIIVVLRNGGICRFVEVQRGHDVHDHQSLNGPGMVQGHSPGDACATIMPD